MLGISLIELIFVLLVAVLVLKPDDLPEIARFCGKIYGKIKKFFKEAQEITQKSQEKLGISELKQEFQSALNEEEAKENQQEIIDIYGKVHKVGGLDQIRSDLSLEELKAEIDKYNRQNLGEDLNEDSRENLGENSSKDSVKKVFEEKSKKEAK